VAVNLTGTGLFSFVLYPNPSASKTSLLFEDIPASVRQILVDIYTSNGNRIFSEVIETGTMLQETFVLDPVNKLAPGLYIISATCGNAISWQKLIIH
jgi:hypothetical protein